ncbi:MAG: hypothetical protein ABI343_00715 [Burkholderiaceae bacterium]
MKDPAEAGPKPITPARLRDLALKANDTQLSDALTAAADQLEQVTQLLHVTIEACATICETLEPYDKERPGATFAAAIRALEQVRGG